MYSSFQLQVDVTGCNGTNTTKLLIPKNLPPELNNVLTFEEYLFIVKKFKIIIVIALALPKVLKKQLEIGLFVFIILCSLAVLAFIVIFTFFLLSRLLIKNTIKKLNLLYTGRDFYLSSEKIERLTRININYRNVQNLTTHQSQKEPQPSSIGIEFHSFSNLYPPETSLDHQTSPSEMETPDYNNIYYNTRYEDACDNIPYDAFDDDIKK
ncbi:hypothetical protein DICPUDRAFT_80743 [Dictyostelium purpureum]|uniref:Uncharacterized protein n=1 Tax=Dictyostelium purpureum TaxID=5786 RepID=F0ZRE2_DICPU|nr:uncharacterized protein DICPUDRAFT_80743 [Dictyostelium purpureum]EGC33498.1 hypothetical protein DICPUDRAFT_80743 [Dictyostelium purpureum]|eukprot:XP_003289972.1 hypothetical protein DICPUDRAFT_80743 [Dictyostelium purpureum]